MPSAEEINYGLNLAGIDGEAMRDALSRLMAAITSRPRDLLRSSAELAQDEMSVMLDVARASLGARQEPPVAPEAGDRRFEDRAWRENPFFRGLLESYLVGTRWWRRQLETADLPEPARRQARFALGILLDALAPTNLPGTNPSVMKEAVDTGGLSLVRGMVAMIRTSCATAASPDRSTLRPSSRGSTLLPRRAASFTETSS